MHTLNTNWERDFSIMPSDFKQLLIDRVSNDGDKFDDDYSLQRRTQSERFQNRRMSRSLGDVSAIFGKKSESATAKERLRHRRTTDANKNSFDHESDPESHENWSNHEKRYHKKSVDVTTTLKGCPAGQKSLMHSNSVRYQAQLANYNNSYKDAEFRHQPDGKRNSAEDYQREFKESKPEPTAHSHHRSNAS